MKSGSLSSYRAAGAMGPQDSEDDGPTHFNWETLVRSAVQNLRLFNNTRVSQTVYWAAVADLLGVGSTSAIELCERFGIDPHDKLPESELDVIARKCGKEMEDETQGPSETCCKMWQHIEDAIGSK